MQLFTGALVASLAVSAHAIATISVKGSKFFTSDGDQFYVKGSCMLPPVTPCHALLYVF